VSDSTKPAPGQSDPATVPPPGYTVPARPDGWPNLLGRRPMSSTDRAKIREALATGLPASALTSPGPFLCYLTIDGLDQEPDPQKATRLRGRINAAARTAAEQHQTSYHATDATMTIGIRGSDAAERVNNSAAPSPNSPPTYGWTFRDAPR
jgi:hypothetical protein